MNTLLKIILFLCCLSLSIKTKSQFIELSYCLPIGNSNSIEGGFSSSPNPVSAAILFPALSMAQYKKCQLKGLAIGISNNATVKDCKIWLANSLEGNHILEKSCTLTTGWNAIMFDQPFTISEEDLVLGYDCQITTSYPLGISKNLPDKNGSYYTMNGKWTRLEDNFIGGSGGNLCIVGLVTGELNEITDLGINKLNIPRYLKTEDQCFVKGSVINKGNTNISQYTITYKIDENTPITEKITEANIPPNKLDEFTISVPITSIEAKLLNIELKITNINGKESDYDLTNNTITKKIAIYDESFKRKILLEHFTGEKCGNCPATDAALEKWVENNSDIIWVHNFSGFMQDIYTVTWDYCKFYNMTSTYAPAIMIDRTWFSPENNPGPVFKPSSTFTPKLLQDALQNPAMVNINIHGNYNEINRQLDLNIIGEKIQNLFGSNTVLTVWLIEDHLPLIDQAGNDNPIYITEHRTVLRKIVTSIFGDEITFNDNNYNKKYSIKINENYNPDNIIIVAFLSNYDQNDLNNCDVHNAQWIKLKDLNITDHSFIDFYINSQKVLEWDAGETIIQNPGLGSIDEKRAAITISKTNITEKIKASIESDDEENAFYIQESEEIINDKLTVAFNPKIAKKYKANLIIKSSVTNNTYGILPLKGIVKTEHLENFENNKEIDIFPNPAKNHIIIDSQGKKITQIEIYDTLGKLIKTIDLSSDNTNMHQLKVEVADLKEGIYILKLLGSQLNSNHKIIIKQ